MFRAQSKHVIKLSVNDNVHLKYQKGFTLKMSGHLMANNNLRPNFDIYIFVLLQIEFNVDKKKGDHI